MKKVLIFLLINFNCFSQQKAFDKERLTYLSKKFIVNEVLGGPKTKPQKVFIDALAATNSKELTTIYYESKVLNIEGLVLSFVNFENGYGKYEFKNIDKESAILFFNTVDEIKDGEKRYLNKIGNNIYFKIDDVMFILNVSGGYKIRVFWKDFDSEWEGSSFEKSRRRFSRNLK